MKKLVLTLGLFVGMAAVSQAQNFSSGTLSVGIDAKPILGYVGNFFGNGGNAAPNINFTDVNQMISGKYFKNENTAYRMGLKIGFGNATTNTGDTLPGSVSSVTNAGSAIGLSGGIQKYRGEGKLKAYYGAEAGFLIGSSKTTTERNGQTAATAKGSSFGLNADAFIGVEYFFTKNISLGSEYSWGLMLGNGKAGVASNSSFGLTTGSQVGSVRMHFYF